MKKPLLKVASVVVAIVMCFTSTITAFATEKAAESHSAELVRASATLATTVISNSKKIAVNDTRYIKTNKVKIRKKPSDKSKAVKTYYKGKKVNVKRTSGDWYKIGKDMWIHKKHLTKTNPMKKHKGITLKYYEPYNLVKKKLTRGRGVLYYNGHKETWYSSKEYGQTRTAYAIPGKHLAKDGTYRDKDGFICVAAPRRYKKGTIFITSLGPAKVYDRGVSGKVLDLYTNW